LTPPRAAGLSTRTSLAGIPFLYRISRHLAPLFETGTSYRVCLAAAAAPPAASTAGLAEEAEDADMLTTILLAVLVRLPRLANERTNRIV
jgi:hypothetical protein